ncbi:hypothetical protein ACH4GK_00640 [Streptomyces rimosus]|uniref:hypothetical protein n=1 Tax=Streptomyces rimosus TaxID=1927 RepID=UPI00067D4C74|nr:hypothetical protein [Streptomyces rimosus]
MSAAVLRWLLAQLGPDTDATELTARYERLHSARAVVLEVLHERRAALLAEPLKVTVNGVATIDTSANVTAPERTIAQLADEPAPDDPAAVDRYLLSTVHLCPRRRR